MSRNEVEEPDSSADESYLTVTKQRWRLRAAEVLLLVGVLVLATAMVVPRRVSSEERFSATLAGIAIPAVAFCIVAFALRCRRCRTFLGGYAMTHEPVLRWLAALEGYRTCPRCGHDPTRAP